MLYDIGDHWEHVIRVHQILPAEESTGAAAVLDGALACPPEDSSGMADSGSRGIQEFLSAVLDRSSPERRRMLAEASKALNYRDRPYKPTDFSVAAAQHALEQALASRASVQSGAKQFMMPFPMMGGGRMGGGMAGLPLWGDGGPMKQVLTEAQGNGSFLQETVSTAKDAKLIAICGSCGNPYDLMTCSGCRFVRFCNRECQIKAWGWHKQECKAEQRRRASAGNGGGS